ncbi:MAG: 3-dehydroquinate synthase, partial [Lachnospiraceae bacterium]|nr:3-dehydroquinate synthase [Lachnospiraceae bacterium]
MNNSLEVTYKNNGSYRVVISDDYSSLQDLVRELFPDLKRICIISDSNVAPLYLDDVRSALKGTCDILTDHVFTAGEESKNLDTVKGCYESLLAG